MRIIITVLFCLLLGSPLLIQADVFIVFADAASSIFRFQYKLAEQGNAEAQYKVGEMYETGRGVNKDLVKAREWYTKSATQEHSKSSYRLLFLDIRASGLSVERKKQVDQLYKEAASGSADAQYFLGRMYAAGVGVKKDLSQAREWLSKATFNGVPEAETDLIAVDEELARIKAKEEKGDAEKQAAAEAERQKKEAAEKARKEHAIRQARERELAAKRAAERKAAARRDAEHQRLEREKAAAAAAERQRQEKLRAEKAAAEEQESGAPKADKDAVFESDPCKGKKAKFLSICK